MGADQLLDLFRSHLVGDHAAAGGGLLPALARELSLAGHDDIEFVIANGIGLLWQTYDATAGLIGNPLVALARSPAVRARAASDPGHLLPFLREVSRHDPPIENTRRFIARRGHIAGQEMAEGDGILVMLAAANRDPASNPDLGRFDPDRREPRNAGFGFGAHACPGATLATTIAACGVGQLLAHHPKLAQCTSSVTYRPSVSTRIPDFVEPWGGRR